MPRSPEAQRRRVSKIKARINSSADDHMPRCSVPDPITGRACGRPTARAERKGLHVYLCRVHQQFQQRHGSSWCRSPTAETMKPYITSALAIVETYRSDRYISAALNGLDGLMQSAGPVEISSRLRGLPPAHRAKIALARLREANIKPERLLAIILAVHALIREAPGTIHNTREWRIVAIAKAAHRMSSGTHRRWELRDDTGKVVRVTEMHSFPRAVGRVLRYLGDAIERECEWVVDHHLTRVLALKIARYGPKVDTKGTTTAITA